MKNILVIISLIIFALSSCTTREGGTICVSADNTTISVNETINISSCGITPPTQYVTTELDWGDGTITEGLSGSHSYNTVGNYNIEVLLNGDYATDVYGDVDESNIKIQILVQ